MKALALLTAAALSLLSVAASAQTGPLSLLKIISGCSDDAIRTELAP